MEWLELGYWGLFFATFLAATIVPFSSEAILAGMLAGGFDPWSSVFIATLGNTLGGMSTYGLGWLGNWHWIEKYLRVKPEKASRWQALIEKRGAYAGLLCWAPFVGDVIALALGLFKTKPLPVAAFMLIGKFARYLLIAWYWI